MERPIRVLVANRHGLCATQFSQPSPISLTLKSSAKLESVKNVKKTLPDFVVALDHPGNGPASATFYFTSIRKCASSPWRRRIITSFITGHLWASTRAIGLPTKQTAPKFFPSVFYPPVLPSRPHPKAQLKRSAPRLLAVRGTHFQAQFRPE